MTRTVSTPDLHPLPRFTFAGRGCRDSRREPRRLPKARRARPEGPVTATAPTTGSSPVTDALAPASGRQSGARPSGASGTARDDRPPQAALRYGPGPWLIPASLWSSNGGAMPC